MEAALRALPLLSKQKRYLALVGRGVLPVLLAIAASLRLGAKRLTDVELLYGSSAINDGQSEERDPRRSGKKGGDSTPKRAMDLYKLLLSVTSREELLYALATITTLLAKSALNVRLVTLLTDVERNLMSRDSPGFYSSVARYVSYMLPQALVNALLHYNVYLLSLKLREKLTRRIVGKFFTDNCFYHLQSYNNSAASGGAGTPSSSLSNVDQLLTVEISEFAATVVSAFLYTVMPSIDIAVHMRELHAQYGATGPLSMGAYYGAAYLLMLLLRLPGSAFAQGEQELEAEYRRAVAHAAGNAEEIASLRGGGKELLNISSSFSHLMAYVQRFYRYRFALGFVDNNVARHFLTVLSWAVAAHGMLAAGGDEGGRYLRLHTYLRLLKSVSGSIGGLIVSSRSVMKILGIGSRLVMLDQALDAARLRGTTGTSSRTELPSGDATELLCAVNNVTVVSPSGILLIKDISFEILAGRSIFISGPSGCGKSTLMRCLVGLGGFVNGSITVMRQSAGCAFLYLPQRPYFTLGSLRDQIVYPLVYDSSSGRARGDAGGDGVLINDALLCEHLSLLDMEGLLSRVRGGLDGVADWAQVLSGGERQRLSLARLLFHRPMVALLDESTSAISEAMEMVVYEECARMQITLVSVSHRTSSLRFHSYQIAIDIGGAYNIVNLHRSAQPSPSKKSDADSSSASSRRSSYGGSSPSSPSSSAKGYKNSSLLS